MMKQPKAKRIAFLVTLTALMISTVTAAEVFETSFEYHKNGTAELNSIEIKEGEPSRFYGTGNQTEYILTGKNKAIWHEKVKYKWIETTAHVAGEFTDEMNVTVRAPYNYSAEKLQIEREGEKVLEVNLTENLCEFDDKCPSFCSGKQVDLDCTCGDGICQKDLNEREFCQRDCQAQEQESKNTGNRSSREEPDQVSSPGITVYIIGGILLIVIAFIALIMSGKVEIEG